jgi:hypothetical protein
MTCLNHIAFALFLGVAVTGKPIYVTSAGVPISNNEA